MKSPRLIMVIPDALIERINDYQHTYKFPTRSAAIRDLIDLALEVIKERAKK